MAIYANESSEVGNMAKSPEIDGIDKYTYIANEGHFILNAGRRRFLEFVLERVKPEKEDEAIKVISTFFVMQDAGALNRKFTNATEWKIIAMLEPKYVEEFKHMTQQSAKC
jgi:hypothetical protein